MTQESPFVHSGVTGLAKLKYHVPAIPRKRRSTHLAEHDRAVKLRALAKEFEETYSPTQLALHNVWKQTERNRHEARARRRAMKGGMTFADMAKLGIEIPEDAGLSRFTEDSSEPVVELTAANSYSVNKTLGLRTTLMGLLDKHKKGGVRVAELLGAHFTEYVDVLIHPIAKAVGAPAGIAEQSVRIMAQAYRGGFVSWADWEMIMWRLAGAASRMARGVACPAEYRLVEPEWAPVGIETCARTVNPDSTVAHIMAVRVLGGTMAGARLHHVFSPKALWFMHKHMFSLPRLPKDKKLTMYWFLGMRTWVCLEPTSPPSFHHVGTTTGTADFNRKVFNGRLKPCQLGKQVACLNCDLSVRQCPFATHTHPIIHKPCTLCNDAAAEFYTGDDVAVGCIGCRTRKRFQQEKANAGRELIDDVDP